MRTRALALSALLLGLPPSGEMRARADDEPDEQMAGRIAVVRGPGKLARFVGRPATSGSR